MHTAIPRSNALRTSVVVALLVASASVLAQTPRVRPESFHDGSTPSWLPLTGFSRNEVDRASELASVASDVTGHLETLTFTRNYARWLVSGGNASAGLLEQQVANGPPDAAAAALLALCELALPDKTRAESDPWTMDEFGACLRASRAGSAAAVTRLAALARGELEQPPLVGAYHSTSWEKPLLVLCVEAASLAGDLGANGRSSSAALAALLDDPRPHQVSDVDTCPRRIVAAALVKVLLSPPREAATVPLAERATVVLVESTLTYWDARWTAPSRELGRLVGAAPPSASLRARLDAAAVRWTKECKTPWTRYGDPFGGNPSAAELGRAGSYFIGALLDRLDDRRPTCDRRETRRQLLKLAAAYLAVHEDGPCRGLSADWASEPLMVSPSAADRRAHFLERSEKVWAQRAAYLTLGDVVFVRTEDLQRAQEARTRGTDSHVCAWYQNGGAKTSGWLSTSDLVEMPSDAQWADIAPNMPRAAGWPTSARRMNYVPTQRLADAVIPRERECAPSVTGQACLRLLDSGRYARHQEDSQDCGSYSVFLFNNGVRIVAEGTGCYGNHGQSDPTGFYLKARVDLPSGAQK